MMARRHQGKQRVGHAGGQARDGISASSDLTPSIQRHRADDRLQAYVQSLAE